MTGFVPKEKLTAYQRWELAAFDEADKLPPTDYSLGIDEPALVAERARAAARFPAF